MKSSRKQYHYRKSETCINGNKVENTINGKINSHIDNNTYLDVPTFFTTSEREK